MQRSKMKQTQTTNPHRTQQRTLNTRNTMRTDAHNTRNIARIDITHDTQRERARHANWRAYRRNPHYITGINGGERNNEIQKEQLDKQSKETRHKTKHTQRQTQTHTETNTRSSASKRGEKRILAKKTRTTHTKGCL